MFDQDNNRMESLLSSTARVEAPFIRVSIGGYTFGVFERKSIVTNKNNGVVSEYANKYPNYVQSMSIETINGTINTYKLSIKYPVTENSDPNFFEKLLSTASSNRRIYITYGDFTLPEYVFKDENAIITNVTSQVDIRSSAISYNIEAVSASMMSLSGTYSFPARQKVKPSDVIKELLYSHKYNLIDVFTGMKNRQVVEDNNLIAGDDKTIDIPAWPNMSILEYINKLVSYMTYAGSATTINSSKVYTLTTYEDTSGTYGGPYFKVQRIHNASSFLNNLCTYKIDIGYPTANIVTDFKVSNSENWSIYYQYNQEMSNSDYIKRINDKGEVEYIYSPQLTNTSFGTKAEDLSWWSKVTQYPMSCTVTLKGLLKPAILMNYVKLNVWFFGKKHIASGYYIITGQTNNIGLTADGYTTTLKLTRISEDEEMI